MHVSTHSTNLNFSVPVSSIISSSAPVINLNSNNSLNLNQPHQQRRQFTVPGTPPTTTATDRFTSNDRTTKGGDKVANRQQQGNPNSAACDTEDEVRFHNFKGIHTFF
jgi:hypothetical protein